MERISDLSNTLPVGENITTLSNQLEWLVQYDDGTQQPQRDSILSEIKSTLAGIESIMAPYRSALAAEVEATALLLQNWEGEEPADDILQEVLNIYFNNFEASFEGYPIADQNTIQEHAGLCAEEFGKGVYLANAIAGTLHNYNLEEYCLPSQRTVTSAQGVTFGRIKAFPSPSRGMVNIKVSGEQIKSIQAFDAFGHKVSVLSPSPAAFQRIDLTQQPAGLYFIVITDNNGERQVEKIVLQR